MGTDLSDALASPIPYAQALDPNGLTLAARELSHERVYYWDDTFTGALPLSSVGTVTLPHHSEQATYDRGQLTSVFGTRIDPTSSSRRSGSSPRATSPARPDPSRTSRARRAPIA